MKSFLFIGITIIMFWGMAPAQCPNSGLDIQSDACEPPQHLKLRSATCSEMNVEWKGGKEQAYLVKATYNEPTRDMPANEKTMQVNTDKSGIARATFQVKEGSTVSWTVQAVCTLDGANIYSSEVKGADAPIPFCKKDPERNSGKTINVYPNPANDYLIIDYPGMVEGAIEFEIFDVSGKKVFSKVEANARKAGNHYTLHISGLQPGAYLLKTANEKDGSSQAKFIILGK